MDMKLLLIPLLVLISVLPSCSLFRGACEKAMPILVQSESYATDAWGTLGQLDRYIDAMGLPADKIAPLRDAITKAKDALRKAQKSISQTAGACTALDQGSTFEAFVQAWDAIKVVLVATGVLGHVAVAASPPADINLPFPEPQVYLIAKSRAAR